MPEFRVITPIRETPEQYCERFNEEHEWRAFARIETMSLKNWKKYTDWLLDNNKQRWQI
jgi:hypothetical protein